MASSSRASASIASGALFCTRLNHCGLAATSHLSHPQSTVTCARPMRSPRARCWRMRQLRRAVPGVIWQHPMSVGNISKSLLHRHQSCCHSAPSVQCQRGSRCTVLLASMYCGIAMAVGFHQAFNIGAAHTARFCWRPCLVRRTALTLHTPEPTLCAFLLAVSSCSADAEACATSSGGAGAASSTLPRQW